MRSRAICMGVVLLLAGGVSQAGLQPGDQMLVDVGVCWDGGTSYPGYGPVNAGDFWPPVSDPGAHGTPTTAASDGNFWNNYSNNSVPSGGGPFALTLTSGAETTVTLTISGWSGCSAGGQVYEIDPASNLYVERAQTDCRWFAAAQQPGSLTLTGLDTGLLYDIKVLSYVSADAELTDAGIPFPAGTVDFVLGSYTVTIDPVDNTTTTADFLGVAPDAGGQIVIQAYANTPDDCGVPLNVIDVVVVPEPAAMVLLVAGGICALRRRRR